MQVNTPTSTITIDPTLEKSYESDRATQDAFNLSAHLTSEALSTASANFPNACTENSMESNIAHTENFASQASMAIKHISISFLTFLRIQPILVFLVHSSPFIGQATANSSTSL
jgi:hypothetical protein